jgi:glycine cleavage system aminomethyltransferase T
MAPQTALSLKRTPLYELHRRRANSLTSAVGKCRAIRASSRSIGLCAPRSVSLTLAIWERSKSEARALEVVQRLTTNDASSSSLQVQYSPSVIHTGISSTISPSTPGRSIFSCALTLPTSKRLRLDHRAGARRCRHHQHSAQIAQLALQGRQAQATLQPLRSR